MLKTYEAIIQDGQVKWLAETPDIKSGHVFITFFEDRAIVNPIVNDSLKQDLLNLFGAEPDAQNIPRRRIES
jgi:hypothetical protein